MTPRSRWGRIIAALLTAVLVILVVAQIMLPPLATRAVQNRLGRSARITSIALSAFPAIELLWGRVDRLDLTMRSYSVAPAALAGKLEQSGEVGTLTVAIGTLNVGPLTLHGVLLHKRDGNLDLSADVDTDDLRRALPIIQSLTPVPSTDGDLTLRGTMSAFGARVSMTVALVAQGGKVIVKPQGLLGAFATVTVFDDPHVFVQSLSGRAVAGGLQISVTAQYR